MNRRSGRRPAVFAVLIIGGLVFSSLMRQSTMTSAEQALVARHVAPEATPIASDVPEDSSDSPTPTDVSSSTELPTVTPAPVATDVAMSTETPTPLPTAMPTAVTDETDVTDTVVLSNAPTAAEATTSLTVNQGASVDFGVVRPEQGYPDGLGTGSYYYTEGDGFVRVTVTGDSPSWSGSCQVMTDNGGTGASSMTVANGALAWRMNEPSSADDDWTDFQTAFADGTCIPSPPETLSGPPYSYTYAYDYRLHVTWADTPGSFQVVITYAVTAS